MITDNLHIDTVVPLPVDKIIFVFRGSLDANVSAVNQSNDSRKPGQLVHAIANYLFENYLEIL